MPWRVNMVQPFATFKSGGTGAAPAAVGDDNGADGEQVSKEGVYEQLDWTLGTSRYYNIKTNIILIRRDWAMGRDCY